jgi:transposase
VPAGVRAPLRKKQATFPRMSTGIGPYTTVYNRFNRCSGRGIWQHIFETVAGSPEPPDQVALDSTHVKTHCCAGSGKGGLGTGDRDHQSSRNSKIHALVDRLCRPWVIILMPGNVTDCTWDQSV